MKQSNIQDQAKNVRVLHMHNAQTAARLLEDPMTCSGNSEHLPIAIYMYICPNRSAFGRHSEKSCSGNSEHLPIAISTRKEYVE